MCCHPKRLYFRGDWHIVLLFSSRLSLWKLFCSLEKVTFTSDDVGLSYYLFSFQLFSFLFGARFPNHLLVLAASLVAWQAAVSDWPTLSLSLSLSLCALRSAPTSRFISKTSEAFRHSWEKISAGFSDILRRPVLIVLRSGLAPVRKSIPPFENPQGPAQSALPSHLQSVGRSTTAQGEGAEAQKWRVQSRLVPPVGQS